MKELLSVKNMFSIFTSYKLKIFYLVSLVVCYYFFYEIYISRMYAFGCFDDCFNIVAGYLMLSGKTLYSDIFFNHQMGMAYLSSFVQLVFEPQHIADLIFRHRQTIIVFGFLANTFLVLRFGFVGFMFAIFYELSKFYVFGDRFLAESLIVYPLVYMFGLGLFILAKKKVFSYEVFAASICAWFVFVMREPYVPAAFLLFAFILFKGTFKSVYKKVSALLLFLGVVSLFLFTTLQDYFFNVFTVNLSIVIGSDASLDVTLVETALKTLLYPVFVVSSFVYSSPFWIFISFLCAFCLLLGFLIFRKYGWGVVVFTYLTLAISNPRPVDVGTIYYEAFHIAPWYGLLVFAFLFFLVLIFQKVPRVSQGGFLISIAVFVFSFFLSQSFLHDDVDRHAVFLTEYGTYHHVSEIVREIGTEENTFFVDGFDELILWNVDKISSYSYPWYTSVMPYIEKYSSSRSEMFLEYPPDIYYGNCLDREDASIRQIPAEVRDNYVRLLNNDVPSCLYLYKPFANSLHEDARLKLKESLYTFPVELSEL